MLTDRATKLQVALTQLKKLHETWARTRDAEESAKAPPPILQQIDATLAAIEAAQQPHQAQRDEILNLQSKVAELVASCNTALAQIAALQQMAVGGIFTPENPPIWDRDLWARAKATLPDRLPEIAASYWRDILLYVRDPSRHMPRHVGHLHSAIACVVGGAPAGRPGRSGRRPSVARYRSVRSSFRRGVAGDLDGRHGTYFAGTGHSEATVRNRRLVPIIVLTRRSLPPIVVPAIYALAILFAIDTVRRAVTGEPPMGQGILVLEAVAGIVVLGWLWRLRQPIGQREVWAKRVFCGGCWLLLFYSSWPLV